MKKVSKVNKESTYTHTQKSYYARNREVVLKKNKLYAKKNREAIKIQNKKHYDETKALLLKKIKSFIKGMEADVKPKDVNKWGSDRMVRFILEHIL